MLPGAADYLAIALDIMEGNSLHRGDIAWRALRAEAAQRAAGAASPAGTYDAIRWALSQLKDGHSFFAAPDRGTAAIAGGQYEKEATMPSGDLRADGIACLHVPAFRGSPQAATRYVDLLQEMIARFDAADPAGWMVDLTENGGGNMWPMLAGLGPLLGEGPLGSFRFPAQPPAIWAYLGGRACLDDVARASASSGGYLLRHAPRPVALLTSQRTASSGEAVLIAFVGRPCSARFGTSTRGLATANDNFVLPDGATLVLTVGCFVDRLGHVYKGPIEPDYFCDVAEEQAQVRAATWIQRPRSEAATAR